MRAHWDTAKYLIKKGADLNVVGGDGGTQINWAAHHDNVEIIKLMLENGAKLNSRNRWGMSLRIQALEYFDDMNAHPVAPSFSFPGAQNPYPVSGRPVFIKAQELRKEL
jgi:hypothetical protein